MPRVADLGELLGEVARLRSGRTRFVGIDGPGGSGKSTLARRVAAAAPDAVVVAVDDFSGAGIAEWDWVRFRAQVLEPLRAGRDARYERRGPDGLRAGELHIPAGSLVIIEGVSAVRDEAGVPWDLTIWVDTPAALRLERVIARDGPVLLERWRAEWLPSEERYIAARRPQDTVDLVVSGTG